MKGQNLNIHKPRKPPVQPAERHDAKVAFLRHFGDGWSVTSAARVAGITRETAYQWRRSDPDFRRAWASAQESGADFFEDLARKYAAAGDARLIMFMLRAKRPLIYGNRTDSLGMSSNPFDEMTDEQLNAMCESIIDTRLGPMFARLGSMTLEEIKAAFRITPLPRLGKVTINAEMRRLSEPEATEDGAAFFGT